MKKLSSLALLAVLGACQTNPTTGVNQLSPTGQAIATVACQVDVLAVPVALPFINGIPTVGGVAATAVQAISHPLVQKACNDLAASLGTGSGQPIVVPTQPVPTVGPVATPTS